MILSLEIPTKITGPKMNKKYSIKKYCSISSTWSELNSICGDPFFSVRIISLVVSPGPIGHRVLAATLQPPPWRRRKKSPSSSRRPWPSIRWNRVKRREGCQEIKSGTVNLQYHPVTRLYYVYVLYYVGILRPKIFILEILTMFLLLCIYAIGAIFLNDCIN